MARFINLVATRSLDGNHDHLHRWYNDHVHLLMGCDALQAATLYRRTSPSPAPDYLCLYEFASAADFQVFETSAARARAQRVVREGWARTGIEIVQRTQYLRLGRRDDPAGQGDHWAALLDLGAGAPEEVARWLNDRVHATWAGIPGARAWHRAVDSGPAGGDALVLGQGGDPDAVSGALGGWADGPADPDFGTRPAAVRLRWQGSYRCLSAWTR